MLAFSALAQEQLARGEMIGVAAALVVLLLVLGALVAASIPLGVAFVSVLSAFAMVAVVGRAFELSDVVLTLTVMLGLALSIDYSLVSVQRFREELATAAPRSTRSPSPAAPPTARSCSPASR
jgi:RND superfamily putative drug exporter